ncbi:MAG: hypothetical protein M1839_008935 [Geoglossum umbratile]|nr:MAG: hypothetical protein M1839_008935 [Geoglossum umbratile]
MTAVAAFDTHVGVTTTGDSDEAYERNGQKIRERSPVGRDAEAATGSFHPSDTVRLAKMGVGALRLAMGERRGLGLGFCEISLAYGEPAAEDSDFVDHRLIVVKHEEGKRKGDRGQEGTHRYAPRIPCQSCQGSAFCP